MKALVIGAGMGGMSAAVALRNANIECEVFEAIKNVRPAGAALSVWSNGVKCMNHLGMGQVMDDLGGPMRNMAYVDGLSGSVMTQFSLAPLIEQIGERPCPVSRADLQARMIQFWGEEKINFGKRLTAVEQTDTQVTAFFDDGSQASGDFLIAADGTHSVVRPYVLGEPRERRYAGYVNWNGLVDVDESIAPVDQWTTFVGEGKRASVMPIADNRFYFFFDVPLPKGLAEDRSTAKADLARYFAGWADPVQRLITAIDPTRVNRVEVHDIEPFATLAKDRVALLGDAGHSTTPDIGQGGCAAMEDAVVLGQKVAEFGSDIKGALRAYEQARNERVKDLVLKARRRCDVTHGKDMAKTQQWYQELQHEQGEHIMAGILETMKGGPLG